MALVGVMTLMIAGFLFVVGLMMLDDIYVNMADDAGSVTNETLTSVTESGENVTEATRCGFNSLSITAMNNATGAGEAISSGNYTVNTRTGVIKFAGGADTTWNNSNWNVSYTYLFGNSSACESTNKTIVGQGKFGDWVDLIVLAIVITIITSMILIGFAFRRTR